MRRVQGRELLRRLAPAWVLPLVGVWAVVAWRLVGVLAEGWRVLLVGVLAEGWQGSRVLGRVPGPWGFLWLGRGVGWRVAEWGVGWGLGLRRPVPLAYPWLLPVVG